jgi:hypothetical protein
MNRNMRRNAEGRPPGQGWEFRYAAGWAIGGICLVLNVYPEAWQLSCRKAVSNRPIKFET